MWVAEGRFNLKNKVINYTLKNHLELVVKQPIHFNEVVNSLVLYSKKIYDSQKPYSRVGKAPLNTANTRGSWYLKTLFLCMLSTSEH